jgi:hypothetical protein
MPLVTDVAIGIGESDIAAPIFDELMLDEFILDELIIELECFAPPLAPAAWNPALSAADLHAYAPCLVLP